MHLRLNKKLYTSIGIITAVLLALYLIFPLRNQAAALPHDVDEIAWFYHTVFYDHLIQGNINDPAWQSLEAYDHPPLSKYLYGGYLQLVSPGFARDRNALRAEFGSWYDGHLDLFPMDSPVFTTHVDHMRRLNIGFSVAAIAAVAILVWFMTKSLLLSLGLTLWLGSLPTFTAIMIRAVSDAHYLFFLAAAFAVFVLYLSKRRLAFLGISVILGALSFSSKLFGGMYFIIIPVFLILETFLGKIDLKHRVLTLIAMYVLGAGVWFILNPTLYPRPIHNSLWYMDMRSSIVSYQMNEPHNMPDILPTAVDRLNLLGCTFFRYKPNSSCTNWNMFPLWPLNVLIFMAGLYELVRRVVIKRNSTALFFLTYLVVLILLTEWKLQFAWTRYLLPHLIIFSLIQCLGLASLAQTIMEFANRLRHAH